MRYLFLILFLSVVIFSCTRDKIDSEVKSQEESMFESEQEESVLMTKQQFMQLYYEECSDIEKRFLDGLSDNIKMYVYKPGVKHGYFKLETEEECDRLIELLNNNYIQMEGDIVKDHLVDIARLKTKSESDDDFYDDVLRHPGGVIGGGSGGGNNSSGKGSSKHLEDNDYINVMRTYTIEVDNFSMTDLFNIELENGSNAIMAKFIYEYDLTNSKVLSADGVWISIDPVYLDIEKILFDWKDKGTVVKVMSDEQGLIYAIEGDVILGKAIDSRDVGFVIKSVDKTGEGLVPYETL